MHFYYRVSGRVETSKQLSVDERLGVIDHEEHNALGHEVPAGLGHDLHVRVHQVPDGLHLPLKLRINRAETGALRLEQTRISHL